MIQSAQAEPHGEEIHSGSHEGVILQFAPVELYLFEPGNVVQECELFAENCPLLRKCGVLYPFNPMSFCVSDLQFGPGQTEFLQIQDGPLMLRV